MAVQARFLSHAFPHDLTAFKPMEDPSSSHLFQDCAPAVPGIGNNTTVLSDLPRSELTCNDNYGFVPRKRPRMTTEEPAAGLAELARQRLLLLQQQQQAAAMHGLLLPCDAQSRAVDSGAASTSGRMANAAAGVSQGLSALLYNQGVETDALIRLESERMRAGLEEARRRHATAVLAAVERAASGRLQAVEADLERARYRNAELEERLRQMTAEGQAWLGVARSHEAVAAGLRATLDQLLQPACAGAVEADAEDAQSCCFETAGDNHADDTACKAVAAAAPSCKACGQGEACVLLLPCRHLSVCGACEPAVDTCPVCAATKNASLHVLLS
ncbi:probable BOI-related E3 ubiquitin-protein ligase 3 [Lolium perenne]|uniref:probable BOI-related E3 ubiquitin-protein ligase 3 n=1 Tax=Lolium perenne TaxID=4522 RepID=UPI0021EAED1B|nr:probable BOI-related E3 ubiquitin-protein ligase 2 [Lolium perenne]XP_051206078.1 probable BOI-related E3 ubiquitin-protein ligase 2 [Lolium perenne]